MAEENRTATRVGAAAAAPSESAAGAVTQMSPSVSSEAAPESVRARAPVAGQKVGKYVIERTIGVGGMGFVVLAHHEQLGEKVAIKLLHPKASKDAVQVERFVREARATVRIKSEHVVRVLDAGADETSGAPFLVMEHLVGRDVGRVLAEDGPLPVVVAVDMMIQICEAVAAAHALGIVHRDLKPSNFFVSLRADGTPLVKVLDFGISKATHADGKDPRLTETQAVFGSPTYMSPEQIRSSKNVDARSDVWSLGVALFEMLSGKLPFVADNVAGLLASVVADAPFRLSIFEPDVPPELEAIVLACLEKDPARRVGSAGELAARLAPFASVEGAQLAARASRIARASAPSVPPPPRPSAPAVTFGTTGRGFEDPRPAKSRGWITPLVVVGAVLLVAGGALATAMLVHVPGPRAATSQMSATTVASPPVEPPPIASVVVGAATTVTPSTTSSALPSASASASARRGKPASVRAGATASSASAKASVTAPPAAASSVPASPNLDSRY